MAVVEPGSGRSRLAQRVKDILLKPAVAWEEIASEPATVGELYKGYVAPLAAIPVVAALIGSLVFSFGFLGGALLVPALVGAVVGYALILAGVLVVSLVIDALAPTFGAPRSRVQAFKVAAYSGTAGCVAGALMLIPVLAPLVFLGGLYGLYLLYLGLPRVMKPTVGKELPYFGAVLGVMVALALALMLLQSVFGAMLGFGGMGMMHARRTETITLPGDHTINLGKLEAQARKAEAAAKAVQSGQALPAAAPETLKAFLPASVAGFARTRLEANGGEAGGMSVASAEGVYEKGGARLTLSVTDTGAASAIAGLAGAFNLKASRQENGRYEKIGQVDGRMTQESWDSAARTGEYSVLVADKFMVRAEGSGVSMDELKAAVRAVDFGRLEAAAASAE